MNHKKIAKKIMKGIEEGKSNEDIAKSLKNECDARIVELLISGILLKHCK